MISYKKVLDGFKWGYNTKKVNTSHYGIKIKNPA